MSITTTTSLIRSKDVRCHIVAHVLAVRRPCGMYGLCDEHVHLRQPPQTCICIPLNIGSGRTLASFIALLYVFELLNIPEGNAATLILFGRLSTIRRFGGVAFDGGEEIVQLRLIKTRQDLSLVYTAEIRRALNGLGH